MSLETAYKKFEEEAQSALDWAVEEVAQLRTGRVTGKQIENIQVEHYGTRTPLQGLASISSVDARTLNVQPWDETAIVGIEKALTKAQLGVNPVVDGKIIRLAFPSLTEEIREQTIKQLHKLAEDARVRLRRGRDEALNDIKKEKASGDLTEDDFYDGKKELDERIDAKNKEIADLVSKKEEEIKTV